MEIRRSYDRLISTMGFPILVRQHLYIESGPRTWRSHYIPQKSVDVITHPCLYFSLSLLVKGPLDINIHKSITTYLYLYHTKNESIHQKSKAESCRPSDRLFCNCLLRLFSIFRVRAESRGLRSKPRLALDVAKFKPDLWWPQFWVGPVG